MATAIQALEAPQFVPGMGQRQEQLRELLTRLSEAVEGGSPRQVVQRVMSDLVVVLKAEDCGADGYGRMNDAVVRNLEAFELSYALGQIGGTGRLLAQLSHWWQERGVPES
jgi:hypothetical protein